MMKIHCLGVSHNTANVTLRENLVFSSHQLHAALARLGCGTEDQRQAVGEFAILSTCNRVEFYAVADKPIFDILETFLAEVRGVPIIHFAPVAYRLLDEDAVAHLLRVAAGLDSMVLGEPQILGQVTDAYSAARQHGSAGKILSRLFQTAIRAGKRTRTETAIGHNPASISSVAVKLIQEKLSGQMRPRILVVGAGEMAELAVEALQKRGHFHVTVVNRTLERARSLADRWAGRAAALESLPTLVAEADAVITSTGAPHTIFDRQMIETAMETRPDRPLVLMDIAMPRDVEVGVEQHPNVYRYDLDSLDVHLESSLASRAAEVPAAEAILAEEQRGFLDYLATLNVVPIITEIRRRANDIREAELEKALRKMPELPPEAQQQIQLATRSIVKKILHHPTLGLKKAAGDSRSADYAEVARSLFGLDGPAK